MKKQKFLTILAFTCLIALSLCSCGQDKKITACIDDLKNGLETRWELKEPSTLDQRPDYYAECANAELNSISKYESITFKDKEFQKIINNYIGALHSQKDGAQYYFSNPKKFQELYYEKGYDIRSNYLAQLCDKYSFDVSDDYKEDLDSVLDKSRFTIIELKEIVEAKSNNGNINISIDGASKSNWKSFDNSIENGYDVILLKCTIENISYYDQYNPGYIMLDNFIAVEDEFGFFTRPYGIAYDRGSYLNAASGFFKLAKGKKIKVAVPYLMDEDTSHILVNIVGIDEKIYELAVEVK